ncbi:MAG TPA: threonine--tRNA ligase [Candidatus Omnitrophica bacterium]|nr:MAG: threonine--tRNA ligase [Omnitrophica WOR_2 bacterium GWA2_53_43]HCI44553.1 threonine--tRNA ligase [Candidatus Omnitrophota bacterium]
MEYKTDLDKLRHSCSHVMAQAVQELWPDVKVTIGPAIENGFYYDFDRKEPFADEDLAKIEKAMRRIIERKPKFSQYPMPRQEAIDLFKKRNELYKVELIEGLPDKEVSFFKTGEEWFDLCKGPHLDNAGQIKAFKLLSVAGSYWRGDERKPMLQRIYGTAFFSQKELDDYLKMLKEAEKRDHRKLGPQLELFDFYHETAGAGLVFYHPAGAMLRKTIEDYVREQHLKHEYQMVITPHILKGKLWEISGHAEHYKQNMYYFDVDQEPFAVKPMNCPGHILIYKSKLRSYNDLPIRYFELGSVYRREKAGVLHGLLRVRGFTQDDAHIFCSQDQIESEVCQVIMFALEVMKDFGFQVVGKDIRFELSTRPDDYIGSPEQWEIATSALESSLKHMKLPYEINEGDGAFYGPKIDVKLKDALGREWQCATIQCDFSLPQRFELGYINNQGKEERPIMIHRAILGSIERFIGMLIEHYGGAFPVWLAPTQAVIIPIRADHDEYAIRVKDDLQKAGVRVIIDSRNESLGKRIREGTVKKVPYLLVVGDKEAQESKVAVRKYGAGDQGAQGLKIFINQIQDEIVSRKS